MKNLQKIKKEHSHLTASYLKSRDLFFATLFSQISPSYQEHPLLNLTLSLEELVLKEIQYKDFFLSMQNGENHEDNRKNSVYLYYLNLVLCKELMKKNHAMVALEEQYEHDLYLKLELLLPKEKFFQSAGLLYHLFENCKSCYSIDIIMKEHPEVSFNFHKTKEETIRIEAKTDRMINLLKVLSFSRCSLQHLEETIFPIVKNYLKNKQ